MNLKSIKTKAEHEVTLTWVDAQFDAGIELNIPAGDGLQLVLLLIKQYEDEHYPVPLPI